MAIARRHDELSNAPASQRLSSGCDSTGFGAESRLLPSSRAAYLQVRPLRFRFAVKLLNELTIFDGIAATL